MRYLLILAFFSAVFWILFRHIGLWLVQSWMYNPFYSHGFVIAGISCAVLIYNGLKLKKLSMHLRTSIWWACAALVMMGIGYFIRFRFFTAASYIFFCIALSKAILEPQLARYIKMPFLLLLLAIPLPFLNEISGMMSFITAKTSAFILDVCFPAVTVRGIDIFIPPDVQFSIGANCSGTNSMLALFIVVILWLVIVKNKPIINNVMLFLTIPIGFVTNVLRIICIFVIARIAGMEQAIRIWHDFQGYFFYCVSLGMLSFSWWILHRMYKERISLRRILIE